MDVQVRLSQQPFEFAVLQLQLAQPFGFAGVHAPLLGALFVERRIAKTVFAPDFLDRHPRLGLPQETDDLLFAVLACSHVHHSPG